MVGDFFGMCIVEQLCYFEHPSASEIRSDDPDPGHIRQKIQYLNFQVKCNDDNEFLIVV